MAVYAPRSQATSIASGASPTRPALTVSLGAVSLNPCNSFNPPHPPAQEQCPSQAEVVTLAYSSKCHSFMGLPLAGGVILLVFIILCPLLVGGVVLYCILKRRRGVQAKADTPYRPMTDHRTPRPRPGYAARPSPAPSHRDRLQEPLVGGGPEGVRLEEDSEAEGGQGGSQYHPPIGALATKVPSTPSTPSTPHRPLSYPSSRPSGPPQRKCR